MFCIWSHGSRQKGTQVTWFKLKWICSSFQAIEIKIKLIKSPTDNRVPLVITFYLLFKDFGNRTHKNLYLLYMVQEAQWVFTTGPMIIFRSARKLSSYLVGAKLYPLERTVGSCKCYDKQCEVCDNVTETSTFTSTVTQNTYKMNHQFNCS